MVAAVEQPGQQIGVAGVPFDEPEPGMPLVALGDRAVLREVVDTHHLVATVEQLRDEIPADEAGRTSYQDLRHVRSYAVFSNSVPRGLGTAAVRTRAVSFSRLSRRP
ncbi:hypothetical protein GCM10029963_18930 [Micromonospora andamanensis]